MPIAPTQEIVSRAFDQGYGVAAINVVNDLSMAAVLAAAEELAAPLIVQTSVKTVRSIGAEVLYAMWRAMAAQVAVPVALHLDHCPDRAVITTCLRLGWNSVLFDGSKLSVEENQRQCREVVEEARPYGALVEGEIEPFARIEDMGEAGITPPELSLAAAVDFIRDTGVDVFAPAIGNAHGMYRATPTLDNQRVTDIVAATGIPVALHGGTGMSAEQFSDLISRGCAKVNISTALKIALMSAGQAFMNDHPGAFDPPSQFAVQHAAVKEMAANHIRMFGSEGQAGRAS
ncbi:class II fructose-bisphosphate aldolase [Pseudactinotalea sp. HY160]|uniref:class II fructose-bisphosphate aldolase n=1 Tax=Pseudactinotalea sp. HY160 TaxID=2654490 RepID=UPI00128D044E|nr:class II fructose-bisphosphate aldolase [Pseudactinotalea sp. HY160]MPV49244.1 class II fructose-bisphosphate aldolase [Pseudactinotalea sp. HY160]